MMKSSVKRVGALIAAAVMVCAIFVGCGSLNMILPLLMVH